MADSHALVTGGSGLVGRHLIEALLGQGTRVTALLRRESELPERLAKKIDRIDCEDWTLTGLQRALGGRSFSICVHLAAYGVSPNDRDAKLMQLINVRVPADLVRLCRERGAAMVMAGSCAEYAAPKARAPIAEDWPLETEKPYGASKAKGGVRACEIAAELGVPFRLLRLFNVYGPGEAEHRLFPTLVRGLTLGRKVALSPGDQFRDFVYVGDVVEAFLAATEAIGTIRNALVWNVCTGKGSSVRDFAIMTARTLGKSEGALGFGDLPMRKDEVPWQVGDPRRIASELGWRAHHDLASGIRAALAAAPQMQAGAVS